MALEITWLGHATVLIELDGSRLLTDPVLGKRASGLVRIVPPVAGDALSRIDTVLVSHLHADHAHPSSLKRVGATATVFAPPGARQWLQRQGLEQAKELHPGQEGRAGPLEVRAVPAVHEGRRHALAERSGSIGFVIRGSRSLYFAGDTDLFPGMADLAGEVDVALLPVSGWGPTLGPGHLDPERAARAVALIRPRVAIPIHWGTLALPLRIMRPPEPARPAREFAALVEDAAPGTEVRVLAPGERTTIH
jgi:L-ascorbate metabolism protein UlaG (beta-lactamase superfamily)